MTNKIEISHKTIVFTVVLILSLWFVYVIRDIIMQFFVALLIMAILNSMVSKLSKYRIPRALSVLVIYIILFAILSFILSAIIPPLADQTSSFINNFPSFLEKFGLPSIVSERIVQQLVNQLGTLPERAARLTVSLFSNILSVVSVLVFAFYLLSERDKLNSQIGYLFGDSKKKKVGRLIDKLEANLGGWARGELILMMVVGSANYVGFRLLGIPFALPLAILAGMLEIVPYIGPILAAIPAVTIGFGISVITGAATLALAFLVQQVENYVFVPQIMKKSIDVNPIVTLLALAIGFRLSGVVGLLISVPVFITLRLIFKEYYEMNETKSST
jgi:predicted PurR-regulated permease PerM